MEQANTVLAKAAVEKANGNLSAAARMLGLTRAQLAYRLEQHENAIVKSIAGRRPSQDSANHP